jgi:hypothetical protein
MWRSMTYRQGISRKEKERGWNRETEAWVDDPAYRKSVICNAADESNILSYAIGLPALLMWAYTPWDLRGANLAKLAINDATGYEDDYKGKWKTALIWPYDDSRFVLDHDTLTRIKERLRKYDRPRIFP